MSKTLVKSSKSRSLHGECGFNSLLRHQLNSFRWKHFHLNPAVVQNVRDRSV